MTSNYKLIIFCAFFAIASTDCKAGVGEITNFNVISFQNYPNPFSDRTTLKINSVNFKNKNLEFVLYDLSGRDIRHQTLPAGKNEYIIEKGKLFKGMYFYKLINEKEIIGQGKLIIE